MQSNQITCLNVRYYCHLFYQAKGSYAHLHQQSDKDLDDAVAAATAKVIYDDPLNLAIPYTFLLERLPKPPEGAIKPMLSLTLILFIYLYSVVRVFIIHWSRFMFSSILAKDNRNVIVRHVICRREKYIPMITLYVRAFAIADDHIKDSFLWDI